MREGASIEQRVEHRKHRRHPARFKSIFSTDGVRMEDGVVLDLSLSGGKDMPESNKKTATIQRVSLCPNCCHDCFTMTDAEHLLCVTPTLVENEYGHCIGEVSQKEGYCPFVGW